MRHGVTAGRFLRLALSPGRVRVLMYKRVHSGPDAVPASRHTSKIAPASLEGAKQ